MDIFLQLKQNMFNWFSYRYGKISIINELIGIDGIDCWLVTSANFLYRFPWQKRQGFSLALSFMSALVFLAWRPNALYSELAGIKKQTL